MSIRALATAGLLQPRGQTKGHFYIADGVLRDLAVEFRREGPRLQDPYPHLMDEVRRGSSR